MTIVKINIDHKDINNFFKEINSNKNKFAKEILITKNLSQKDVSKLAVRSLEFPEVSFLMTKKRVYPQGIIAGHITGYIGPYSEKDSKIKANTAWFQVGKAGLEEFFEKDLRGKFGRILGDFVVNDLAGTCGDILCSEGHAVRYHGQNKEEIEEEHLKNRERLIQEGKVVL